MRAGAGACFSCSWATAKAVRQRSPRSPLSLAVTLPDARRGVFKQSSDTTLAVVILARDQRVFSIITSHATAAASNPFPRPKTHSHKNPKTTSTQTRDPMLPRLLLLSKAAPCPRRQQQRPVLSKAAAAASSALAPACSRAFASFSSSPASAAAAAASGPKTATPPADASRGATADLLDVFHPQSVDEASQPRAVQIAEPIFRDFGGRLRFSGPAATVKCFENNPLVRAALEEKGNGRVLVVDGGGSKRCALLGDNIAALGARNGWSGIIINGCVRDTADIATFDLGVKALAAYPLKSSKRDPGLRDVPVHFAGVTIKPGDWVYADGDGVIVSETELKLESKV